MTDAPRVNGDQQGWAAILERLRRTARAARAAAKPSRQAAQAILEARARALAEAPPEASAAGRMLELVTFTLGGERLALETRYVRAVAREAAITPLPASPDVVLGVTSFRGEIAAVFDVGAVIGRRSEVSTAAHLLFVGRGAIEFAILADAVHEVVRTPAEAVVRRPWGPKASATETAGGLTPEALNIIDGAALLDDERFAVGPAPG